MRAANRNDLPRKSNAPYAVPDFYEHIAIQIRNPRNHRKPHEPKS